MEREKKRREERIRRKLADIERRIKKERLR